MSVLPDAGNELQADSDVAVVVCTALLDEAVDIALDVVGLHVGQWWFLTAPEDALPVILDEHSMMCDLVRLDSVPVDQDFMSTDVCVDDRFSPGVRDDVSLDWQIDLDSHGTENWECRLDGGDGALAGVSDWRSVLRWVALMSCSPEFPNIDSPNLCLTMLILRVDFGDVSRNCTMDVSARRTCPRVRTPECGLKTFAQTLPTRQECLVHDVLSSAVARLCAVARKNPPTRARLLAWKIWAI